MRISRLRAILAAAIVVFLQISAPTPAHANTYNIVGLSSDNVWFYGMDDIGHVVFSADVPGAPGCPYSATICYKESGIPGYTAAPPSLAWDFASQTCSHISITSPCSLTYKGTTAVISTNPLGNEDLSISTASSPSQVVATTGFGGIFAINGVGDVVYDDGLRDEWYDAVDPPSPPAVTPEPSSLLLLGTGMLTPLFFLLRRSAAVRL